MPDRTVYPDRLGYIEYNDWLGMMSYCYSGASAPAAPLSGWAATISRCVR